MSSLSQLIEWLGTNPWLNIVGFMMAILGIALAFLFYIKSKKVKLPHYSVRSTNVIRDLVSKINSLEVLYSGQQIKNLTVSKIAFWNAGSDTINRQDIASADPLIIRIENGYKILDAKILYTKKSANQFSINISKNQSYVTLQFDYIDKGQGVVVQLIHTGKSSKDIKVQGTIKGAGNLTHKSLPSLNKFPLLSSNSQSLSLKKRRYIIAIILFIFPLITVASFFMMPETPAEAENSFIPKVIISLLSLVMYWGTGYHILKRRMPKGFDVFEEEF